VGVVMSTDEPTLEPRVLSLPGSRDGPPEVGPSLNS
jgi:hypothetical protein